MLTHDYKLHHSWFCGKPYRNTPIQLCFQSLHPITLRRCSLKYCCHSFLPNQMASSPYSPHSGQRQLHRAWLPHHKPRRTNTCSNSVADKNKECQKWEKRCHCSIHRATAAIVSCSTHHLATAKEKTQEMVSREQYCTHGSCHVLTCLACQRRGA